MIGLVVDFGRPSRFHRWTTRLASGARSGKPDGAPLSRGRWSQDHRSPLFFRLVEACAPEQRAAACSRSAAIAGGPRMPRDPAVSPQPGLALPFRPAGFAPRGASVGMPWSTPRTCRHRTCSALQGFRRRRRSRHAQQVDVRTTRAGAQPSARKWRARDAARAGRRAPALSSSSRLAARAAGSDPDAAACTPRRSASRPWPSRGSRTRGEPPAR